MKIFIAGSCVTRDAFTPDTEQDFKITSYYARYSLARLNFPVINIDISPILFEEKIASPFQRNLITNELSNNLIERLKETEFDYLVIDCTDERFGLVKYNDSIYVTNSAELNNAQIFVSSNAPKILADTAEFYNYWRDGLKQIIDVVGIEKIIINNVFWTRILNNGEDSLSVGHVNEGNKMLKQLYCIAREEGIPDENFVNYPADILVADANHKWGRSPYHFTRQVYLFLIEYLNNLSINSP